ncbi:hypothetical protein R6Q57_024514 [Mikania cordata]
MFTLNPRFNNQNPNHPANFRHRFNGGLEFRLETMEEDSGVCSPPLWRKISPPDSPARFPNSRPMSPAARAQAIARGQREMMEMVENMPETSYELSLKDIVEQRREFIDHETQSMEEGEARLIVNESQKRRKNSVKNGRIIVKTGSLNHNKGLLINMFFPFSIGSKKKMNSIRTTSYSSNHGSGGVKSGTGDRRDWWKRFTDSGKSESLGISSSSSGGRSGSSGSSGSSTASSLRNNSHRYRSFSLHVNATILRKYMNTH